MRYSLIAIMALFVLAAPLFSVLPLNLVQPQETVSAGGAIDYGTVGPGQSFSVKITPTVHDASGKYLGLWAEAYAINLPPNWTSRPSGLDGDPLVVSVQADPMAAEGDYTFTIMVIDENGANHIADTKVNGVVQPGNNTTFDVVVHVSKNVLGATISPLNQQVGAGQPARFVFTLTNLGTAPDTFNLGSTGVKDWSYEMSEYLAPGETKTYNYEVVGEDEAYYPLTLYVQSQSSPQIRYAQPVTLQVSTNLVADYKATSHGVLLYPPVMLPVYSLSGLLGLFFP